MTVSTSNNRDSYAGDDVTLLFPYTFRILASSEILVTLADALGVETVQVLDTDYTVDTITQTGGDITMAVEPAAGETLVFTRNVAKTQGVDLTRDGPLPAETVEQALDRLTMITQELSEVSDRSLITPVTSSTVNLEFPAPVASELIAYNSAGTALETVVNPAVAADASATAAAASAAAAAISETNAQTAETNAETAETNAETAETNAETAEANAAVSAAAAAASAATFTNLRVALVSQVFN